MIYIPIEISTDKASGETYVESGGSRSPPASPGSAADATDAASSAVDVGVGGVEGVASLADHLGCVCRLKCVAAKKIHSARYGFEMAWVYTELHPAKVIDVESVRNRAVCAFPGETVSANRLARGQRESPVAVGSPACSPEPASVRMTRLRYLSPEPFGDILFWSRADSEVDRRIAMNSQSFVMRPAEPARPRVFPAVIYQALHVQKYTILRRYAPR